MGTTKSDCLSRKDFVTVDLRLQQELVTFDLRRLFAFEYLNRLGCVSLKFKCSIKSSTCFVQQAQSFLAFSPFVSTIVHRVHCFLTCVDAFSGSSPHVGWRCVQRARKLPALAIKDSLVYILPQHFNSIVATKFAYFTVFSNKKLHKLTSKVRNFHFPELERPVLLLW